MREHYDIEARHRYETIDGKLYLLQTILAQNWIAPEETWKLQSLGVTLGDALSQRMAMFWCIVKDEYGRDPALQLEGMDKFKDVIVFPLTTISKRVERGEVVDIQELFEELCDMVLEKKQARSDPKPSS